MMILILQKYLPTMSTTSKADARTHSAARHNHSSQCSIETSMKTQVQVLEDPFLALPVALQAVVSKPPQIGCKTCSMYSGHTTNRSYQHAGANHRSALN
eukprot:9548-Heterococcus_DN1.PRE.2